MFGFLKPQPPIGVEPLQSPAAASAWLRCLPSRDDAGRQRNLLLALDDVRRMTEIDHDCIAAVEFVDAAIEADRRRLLAQYITHVDRSAAIALSVWQSMYDTNQGFVAAYRAALQAAVARPRSMTYQSLIPQLLARLIRCIGIEGKLRAFRYQRLIPARWRDLHELYMQAIERGIEHVPLTQNDLEAGPQSTSVRQEYLRVLLDDRINTGNLSPAEFDIVSERLRNWISDVTLDGTPPADGGFVVDLEGKTGLVRRASEKTGALLRFVDSTALVARFQREIAALKALGSAEGEPAIHGRKGHIAALEKSWPAFAMREGSRMRCHARAQAAQQADVRVGLSRVCEALDTVDGKVLAFGAAGSSARDARSRLQFNPTGAPVPIRDGASARRSDWTIFEKSPTGMRIRASAGAGQRLAVGTLLAIKPFGATDWSVSAVRRVCHLSNDLVEAGVSILSEGAIAATLHMQRTARDDMHFVVDGIDVSEMGTHFRGLYIHEQGDSALSSDATLIVSTGHHDMGHRAVMTAGDEVRALVFREPLEQHADWTSSKVEWMPSMHNAI